MQSFYAEIITVPQNINPEFTVQNCPIIHVLFIPSFVISIAIYFTNHAKIRIKGL